MTQPISSIERRNIFDKFALGCISYLEQCEECRSVTFHGNDPALSHEFTIWERKYTPLKLPEDLKKFYSIMNGFSLQWGVEIGDKLTTIGEMRLNKLDQMSRVSNEHLYLATVNQKYMELKSYPDFSKCSIFSIDVSCEFGEVVLLYKSLISTDSNRNTSSIDSSNHYLSQPEVWLLDNNGGMTYLCSCFTHYFRLLIVHLGMIGWQGIFLDCGLSEITQQWMNIFCRERLYNDLSFRLEAERKNMMNY
jgi:tubulin polyglutamylase complex subunit 2